MLIAIVRFPDGSDRKEKERAEIFLGIRRMLSVPGLRRSLMISLQVSVVGGLAIVTTAGYVKNELKMEEAFYPVAMSVMGIGAMVAAIYFSRCKESCRRVLGLMI
ncbi:MAG: hypothetical protein MK172_07365, partial [Verrucomicrobiales bacterium]|nr:hypothetical protein [Verrucomicrobiales bacterium]